MSRTLCAAALVLIAACSVVRADSMTESAQQKLKDSGFYYGEINGKKDADTTAAIRRYQIRNGLQVTGELNDETLRSLGLSSSKPAAIPPARPAHSPAPTPPGFLEETPAPKATPAPPTQAPPPNMNEEEQAPPQPSQPRIEGGNVFGGTPYETAPLQVQQDVVARAQMILMRQGYYRDEIDGLYGPAMSFALRNYQARFGLQPSGRLDVETLASLSLLPEQRLSGPRRYHRRFFPRIRIGPGSEPIYIPR